MVSHEQQLGVCRSLLWVGHSSETKVYNDKSIAFKHNNSEKTQLN